MNQQFLRMGFQNLYQNERCDVLNNTCPISSMFGALVEYDFLIILFILSYWCNIFLIQERVGLKIK